MKNEQFPSNFRNPKVETKEVFIPTLSLPHKEESSEEYISRSMSDMVSEYIDKNEDLSGLQRLIKKSYYGRHANEVIIKFFSEDTNSNEIKNILLQLELNDDNKFSQEKNNKILNKLNEKIWSSNKESADGSVDDKIEYYSSTNQVREFFSYGRKYDAHSYSSMVFGLPEEFIKTKAGKEYVHHKIDNKNIFLFGGGDSIRDLLISEDFKPKRVINFDPFIKDETIDKNINGIYESQMISASDKRIREMVARGEIPKADEIWATYSVPFYLDSPEEIKELIQNMASVLDEGGNARISPIAVQSEEKNGDNFETRKEALINSIKELLDSSEYNISIFNNTLKIHKIDKSKTVSLN